MKNQDQPRSTKINQNQPRSTSILALAQAGKRLGGRLSFVYIKKSNVGYKVALFLPYFVLNFLIKLKLVMITHYNRVSFNRLGRSALKTGILGKLVCKYFAPPQPLLLVR